MTKATVSGINWSGVSLTNETGSIDVEQTMAFLREELVDYVSTNEIPADKIREVVSQVFTKVTQIDLNGLASRCALLLDAPVGSETKVQKRVLDFVRAESAAFKDSKGEKGGFVILPGARGGMGSTRASSPETLKLYTKMLETKAAKATKVSV